MTRKSSTLRLRRAASPQNREIAEFLRREYESLSQDFAPRIPEEIKSEPPEVQIRWAEDFWRRRHIALAEDKKQTLALWASDPLLAHGIVYRDWLLPLSEEQSHRGALIKANWGVNVDPKYFAISYLGHQPVTSPNGPRHYDADFAATARVYGFVEALIARVEMAFKIAQPYGGAAIIGTVIDAVYHSLDNLAPMHGITMEHGQYMEERDEASILFAGWVAVQRDLASTRTFLARDQILGPSYEAWCDTEETNDPNAFLEQLRKLMSSKPYEPVVRHHPDITTDRPASVRDEEFFAREEAKQQHAEMAVEDARTSLPEYLRPVYDDMRNKVLIKETAKRLGVSENTVKGYRREIKRLLEPAADDILATN